MARKCCNIESVNIRGDEEILLREKRYLETNMLFLSISVVVIQNFGSGIHDWVAHTKMSC